MTQTKLVDLINPEVMGDMISATLPSKLKFTPLSRLDRTLQGVAGNTITLPVYQYIGEAETVEEGVEVVSVKLTTTKSQHTVKKAVKSVTLTDEDAVSAEGDPIGQTKFQIEQSIIDKIDSDSVTALLTATKELDAKASISFDVVSDAVDLFEEEDDEPKILFLHPNQRGTIKKSTEYKVGVEDAFMKGVVAEIGGCQVVFSKKVPNDKLANTYTNFIVKEGALAMILKRDLMVEEQRNAKAGATDYVANQHFVVALENDSKVVKIKTTK